MKGRLGRPIGMAGAVFLLLVIWSAPADAGNYRYTYRFQKPDIVALPNGRHLVQMQDTRHNDEVVGAPILPLRTARLFVPADEEVVSVDVKERRPTTLEGYYDVQFAVQAYPLSAVGPFPPNVPAANIYQKDAFFPPGLYKKKSPQYLLGVQIVEVDLAPVQYNPVNGKLKYYDRLQISVTTRKAAKPKKTARYRGLGNDKLRILKAVDNKADFVAAEEAMSPSEEPAGPTEADTSAAVQPEAAEYLVITTTTLTPAFEQLTAHRASISGGGYTTHIEDIANIAASYTGDDLAEKVRNYIRDMYDYAQTRYVVLGGDVNLIPTRGCYAQVGEYIDNNIPSDLYFGCLDGPWDGDGDGIWCEANDGIGGGDIDWQSEVYIGRISADESEISGEPSDEAMNHIQKIIASEINGRPERALLVGEKLDDVPTWGGDRMDLVYLFMGTTPNDTLYDRDGIWSSSTLISLIDSNEYHWLNHLGHSDSTYNMKMGISGVGQMTNSDYFLLYSQGCYSGNIGAEDCFGEAVTNHYADRGAHAYIGNSRYGWYNAGSYVQGGSNLMHKEFAEAVFSDNYTRLGEANQIPKAILHSGTHRWISFELNLLGDPAYDLNPTYCSRDVDCVDGLYCNGEESCVEGVCREGSPVVCDDGDFCTGQEECVEGDTGPVCESGGNPCDDWLACNGLEECVAGACREGDPVVCDDGVFCNGQEECVEAGGEADCVSSGDPCPAGCDEAGDFCFACTGPSDCDDGNVCTLDICEIGGTAGPICQNTTKSCGEADGCCPAGCNEGSDPDCAATCGDGYCNGLKEDGSGEDCLTCPEDCGSSASSATCNACFKGKCDGVCLTKKEDDSCTDCAVPTACCGNGTCDDQGGETAENCPVDCDNSCSNEDDCSDGLFCNGSETCNLATGACLPGTPPACEDDDSLFCNGVASCNEGTDRCEITDPCAPGKVCDEENDVCNEPPECDADEACDDGNICTADTCDASGSCANEPIAGCSDPSDCFKKKPDGKCNPKKDGPNCPDCL